MVSVQPTPCNGALMCNFAKLAFSFFLKDLGQKGKSVYPGGNFHQTKLNKCKQNYWLEILLHIVYPYLKPLKCSANILFCGKLHREPNVAIWGEYFLRRGNREVLQQQKGWLQVQKRKSPTIARILQNSAFQHFDSRKQHQLENTVQRINLTVQINTKIYHVRPNVSQHAMLYFQFAKTSAKFRLRKRKQVTPKVHSS